MSKRVQVVMRRTNESDTTAPQIKGVLRLKKAGQRDEPKKISLVSQGAYRNVAQKYPGASVKPRSALSQALNAAQQQQDMAKLPKASQDEPYLPGGPLRSRAQLLPEAKSAHLGTWMPSS